MKGAKARSLIEQVAKEQGVPAERVEAVFKFYWNEVRSHLIEPDRETRIHLENLGDFVVKPWSLKKEIERFENFIEVCSGRERVHQDAVDTAKKRLNTLRGVLAVHEEETQRKKFINQHKEAITHVTISSDLEE